MMKYYDEINHRILVYHEEATPEFWDFHWQIPDLEKKIKSGKNNNLVKWVTRKFLNPPAKILDAGCGIGQNVYGFDAWGYDGYGVDFAGKTISVAKQILPDLKISRQNVENLDFPDNYFDGYWSLGVIEHDFEGYLKTAEEAHRVIKKKGYLFLTFPWMSPLRRLKVRKNRYPAPPAGLSSENFYEFFLDEKAVIKDIEKLGFRCRARYPYDATKGLKDEIPGVGPVLQKIYDSKNTFARISRYAISRTCAWFAGHVIALVFEKM